MVLVEDDSILHPEIAEDLQLYVSALDEGHSAYERYFDALLIKRSQHRSFYRDLRAFREQSRVISLLQRAPSDKACYKETTTVFLESRFAHPWCRRNAHKKGFWRAEWGNIQGKARDAEVTKEELRLHKLLLPIWIVMGSRMLPKQEILTEWCAQEKKRRAEEQERRQQRLTMAALQQHNAHEEARDKDLLAPHVNLQAVSESGLDEEERRRREGHAATSVFRLAAAGMILNQTPKRKLRWLTKKPT